jgi:hypothetical protein
MSTVASKATMIVATQNSELRRISESEIFMLGLQDGQRFLDIIPGRSVNPDAVIITLKRDHFIAFNNGLQWIRSDTGGFDSRQPH